MLKTRELRELFHSPVFYIVTAIFIALSGYKFYSLLLSFVENMSFYPDYVFGEELSSVMGANAGAYIFPQLFMFYAYLCVMSVSVISMGIGHDRMLDLDKIELLASRTSPLKLILRKVLATFVAILFMLIPTLLYPAMLSLFSPVDWGVVLSSYVGLSMLVLLCAALVSIPGVFKLPQAVGVFLNLVILLSMHFYFFDPILASFFFGVIRASTVVFFFVLFIASLFLSLSFYKAVKTYK